MIVALALLACGQSADSGSTTGTTAAVTFADIQPRFDQNCTSSTCHGVAELQTGLQLTADVSYGLLVDVDSVQVPGLKRVSPGDVEGSYLWHKLNDAQASVGGSGTRMPPYYVLADNDLQLFRDWIEQGALP